jgi:hypothetical protein
MKTVLVVFATLMDMATVMNVMIPTTTTAMIASSPAGLTLIFIPNLVRLSSQA